MGDEGQDGARGPDLSASSSNMCEQDGASGTITIQEQEQAHGSNAPVHLRLKKPKNKKKVDFQPGTVDNEHMNKKKSKCCCIYKKPHAFGESSSDTDDECEHCHGHVENRKNPDQPEVPPV